MVQSASVTGTVVKGHQIASGQAPDSPYPAGSIELQIPHFKALGLDLSEYFFGTLNIAIAPHKFQMRSPLYRFEQVKWIANFNAETFSFADCILWFKSKAYQGFVYYPHPETKTQHFHNESLLEIICKPVSGIQYGDRVKLEYNPEQLIFK